MKVGYARVSTDMQCVDAQLDALRAAGCKKVFTDEGISATAKDRPGLAAARKLLKPGDTFVVWAIDRAFRSTIDAILFLDALMNEGIEFQSLTQHINTRTPEGRKWFIDTASWAEYERAIISRRTKERMAAAKRRGQHLGRPYLLNDKQVEKARGLIADGMSMVTAARRMGVSRDTLRRALMRKAATPHPSTDNAIPSIS